MEHKGQTVHMKICGELVDILISIDQNYYQDYVTYERGQKVIYVELLKAIYGTLEAALLFYKKLRKDLEENGYKINPYDPCVANKMINGKQHTVMWHVDDLMASHVDANVNEEFIKWVKSKYEDPDIGEVKVTRGKIHKYLGMTFDFQTEGKLKVRMEKYVNKMI